MLQLYKEKPVTISMLSSSKMVNVEFCNVSMKLKFCQFKLFHNYLLNQLTHGVEAVMLEKFGYNSNKYLT